MNYTKRIAVWAEPRTGSTYYTDCIKRYFQANGHTDSDVFIQKERIDIVLADFLTAYEAGYAMGIRNHLEHLHLWNTHGLNDIVSSFHNVFLYRRNIFDQVISNWIGTQTQVWNTGDPEMIRQLYQNRYVIPESEFVQLLTLRWNELTHNYNSISYDDQIAYEDLVFIYDTDIRLLNIQIPYPIYSPVRSVPLPNKRDQVHNWNELKAVYQDYIPDLIGDHMRVNINGELVINNSRDVD
jgi:hypothetical protein